MIEELIKELDRKNVQLTCTDGKLKFSGPENEITPELLSRLKENKELLIKYLTSQGQKNESFPDSKSLILFLENKNYKFQIENTRLIYTPPLTGHNEEVENAITKHYRNLYYYYWPLPNKNLVPIQPEGSADPFFIVHGEQASPIMKTVFGPEMPLFDFFHQSEDGSKMNYRGIKKMAKYYLDQLLLIKNEGEYMLGGYSFGGLLAYEMALQMKAMGKKIKLLILIDTVTPKFKGWEVKPKFNFYSVTKRFKYYISDPYKEWYKKNVTCNKYFLRKEPLPPELRQFYIINNYIIDSKKYKPSKFEGKLYLITAEGQKQYEQKDPYLGWKDFIKGDIEVITTPGNHFDIIKNPENAKSLSKVIKQIAEKEMMLNRD